MGSYQATSYSEVVQALQEKPQGIGLLATRLLPIDTKWLFPDTLAVVDISLKSLVDIARVDVHASGNGTFHVFSQIPGGTIFGIRSFQHVCLFQTTGLQILHSSVSNDDLSRNYAIRGTGLDTDKHYGEQNRLAKRNLAELLHPSPISEDKNVMKPLWDNWEKPISLYSMTLTRRPELSWT